MTKNVSRNELNLTNQLCFAIYDSNRLFNKFYQQALKPFELTYPQYIVLLSLWEDDRQSLKDLSEELSLKSNTLTPLLKRLEDHGWVVRNRPTSDKRQLEICLTEKANENKDAVKRWVNYLLKKDPQAFIFVQKKLLGLAKEKNQQSEIFLLLLFYFQEERDRLLAQGLWGKEINRAIEAALRAQNKLQANVSFQGVAEQFSVKIIYG